MAVVLAKASTLKAEVRLGQAISEFQTVLSTEQKKAFRTAIEASTREPPGLQDVIRVTEEIDRTAAALLRSRRCFGPRVTNVLHSIQQFAALGDVIVGGSQNILACGVWTLVRMTLLTAARFSSYLEQLSSLLMNIGRSAPRYERLKELYPQSQPLQSNLFEYFILVVRLCHKVVKLTKKSGFGQVIAFLSESDMKTYQSELNAVSALIKEEMTLLMAKEIRDQGSGIKSLVRSAEADAQRQKLETRHRVLLACSTYDHETAWKETRKLGTASWFREVAEYKNWKASTKSATLICTGKLGSGKSVLLANVVGDLSLQVQTTTCPVVYFFCRDDTSESTQARTVIGSLVRQLLHGVSDLSNADEVLGANTPPFALRTILEMLRRSLPPTSEAYLVLDGLDECHEQQRRTLIYHLGELQEMLRLRVCIACGSDIDSLWKLKPELFSNSSIMSVPEENPEMRQFIKAELVDRIEARRLIIGDPSLALEIEDALIAGSQGMFLWVALQIESICSARTDEAIRRALKTLPRTLPETFSRILERPIHTQADKSYQVRTFELLIAALRPLTTAELREALSVTPGDDVWDPARLLNDVTPALACCGSLVMVDEENLTVRLIHHSVKQYLLGTGSGLPASMVTWATANSTIRGTVFTYLNYGVFDTQLSTSVASQLFAEAAPHRIIHSMDAPSITRKLALRLLKSRNEPGFDIGKTIAEASRRSAGQSDNRFRFHSYASSYWTGHAYGTPRGESVSRDMLSKLIDRRLSRLSGTDDECKQVAFWAAADGSLQVLSQCLDKGVDVEARHPEWDVPLLLHAAAHGQVHCVRKLLKWGADVEASDCNGRTALSWAAGLGYHDVVVALIGERATVHSWDSLGRTPLLLACEKGAAPVVQSLVEHGAHPGAITLGTKLSENSTPLSVAIKRGDTTILKLLLSPAAQSYATARGDPLASYLEKLGRIAVECDQLDIVKVLVGLGDAMVGEGATGSFLSVAAQVGSESAVKILLELGADANYSGRAGRPLCNAAENGHDAIVELLLKAGAKPTPASLYAAAMGDHHAAIKALVAVGVEKNAKYGLTQMPILTKLITRVDQSKVDNSTIKLLIDLGCDLEATDEVQQTPLLAAAQGGNAAVVKMLIDAGANMEHRDVGLLLAVDRAGLNGKAATFELLLEHGALLTTPLSIFEQMVLERSIRDVIRRHPDAIRKPELQSVMETYAFETLPEAWPVPGTQSDANATAV